MPSPLPDSTQTTKSLDAFSVTFQAYRLDQLTYFLLSMKNFDHHYTKRKPTCFFLLRQAYMSDDGHGVLFWELSKSFFFFHTRFLWRFIIKIMLWYLKAFLLSLLWYLLVFCALQKCKCVCISVDVYFVVVHKMFIL